MRIIKPFLNFSIFVSIVIFLFSAPIIAQTAANYKFLEVVDFAGKPVESAAVKPEGYNPQEQLTDQKGQIGKGMLVYGGDYNTTGFTITKPGYYPFRDIFEIIHSPQPIRIELLVIPKTPDEVKAIGNEQLKRELFAAARNGDAAAVRKFLKMGLDPNLTTFDLRGIPKVKDLPAIIYAAKSGDAETIKEFLSAGVNIRAKEGPIRSILNAYLYAGPSVRFILKTEEDRKRIMSVEEQKQIMSVYGNGAEALVKAGADIEYVGPNEIPALMIAAGKGYHGILEILIKSGARINAQDALGNTALIYAINAAWLVKPDIKTLSYLLKSGADPNIIAAGKNYIYDYCDSALLAAVRKRNPEAVKLLIQYKVNVNLACKNGETALSSARRDLPHRYYNENLPEIINLLEAAGAK